MADVLVVGAGPVGLALAAELARHGVSVRVIEARTEPLPFCRAIGVTPRTLEVYEDMGIARAMIDAGLWLTGTRLMVTGAPTRDAMMDLADLPYSSLGVPQGETERILTAHLATFGIAVERGVRLVSFTEIEEGVQVSLEGPAGPETDHARYVVGCDGAHSTVRHQLGIPFEGEAFPMPFMLGDVHLDWPAGEDLPRGMALRAMELRENDAPDMFIAIPLPEHNRYRVSMLAPMDDAQEGADAVKHGIQSERPGPSLAEIQAAADRVMANPPTASDLRWSSRFRISMRLAERYRMGRAFIAGDAAHIHPPTGGQGMNTGIQDAYNLAWKLALVLKGAATPALLDTYEAERRPVAEGVIAQTVEESINLGRPGRPMHRLAHTQILVNYRGSPIVRQAAALREGAPEAGDRAPDVRGLRRRGVGFALRLFDLLRGTEHVLICPVSGEADCAALEAGVQAMQARGLSLRAVAIAPAGSNLPDPVGFCLVEDEEGDFAKQYGPGMLLVRPDKYVGWIGATFDELSDFISVAFGPGGSSSG